MEVFLGLDHDTYLCLMLFLAGILASFVDSIVGGGGLISVPAFLLTNLPPSVALGSNKLGSVIGAAVAGINYARKGFVEWHLVIRLLPFTFLGAVMGVILVLTIPPLYLKPLIILLLVMVTIYVMVRKSWGVTNNYVYTSKVFWTCAGFSTIIGLYDGFVGPGTGTFLIFMFISAGYDFIHATGNAKILNFMSNLVALALFIYFDQVNYQFGLACGFGQIIGAYIGSRLAMLKGSSLVRIVFLSTTFSMIAKLIYDYISIL